MIPVRAQGLPQVVGEFAEAGPDLFDQECPACDEPLGSAPVSLVYVGPGSDPGDQERARRSSWHTGAAVAVHAACAGKGKPE